MDNKKLNTTYDFELEDGNVVKLSLSFYSLYKLRSDNKALYERYNRIMANNAKGNFEELDSVFILYTAYVCANIDDANKLNEEEFILRCGSDRDAVSKALGVLINPKKAKASGNRS
jgi:hypothetical protein